MSELVRIWKESKPVRGTYTLGRVEVRTGQDTKRKQVSKGHLLSREGRGGIS